MIENFIESSKYAQNLFKIRNEIIQDIKKESLDENVPIITDEVLNYMIFTAKNINVSIQVILKTGFSISDIKEKIESLLKAVIKTGNATFEKSNKTILSINRLEKAILEIDGVNDNFVKVNNSNSNLEIAEDEILIVGTVVINE